MKSEYFSYWWIDNAQYYIDDYNEKARKLNQSCTTQADKGPREADLTLSDEVLVIIA